MSKIAITGAATGTATFTIESPATSTNRTLTIPDATGTIDRLNRAGNVLQVVYAQPSNLTTSSTSSTTSAPEWGSVTITPTASGNKLVCFLTGEATYATQCQGESTGYLTSEATGVAETVFALSVFGDETTSGRPKGFVAIHGQVTTSTTNTYTIRARANGRDINAVGKSLNWHNGRLTVMEIAA